MPPATPAPGESSIEDGVAFFCMDPSDDSADGDHKTVARTRQTRTLASGWRRRLSKTAWSLGMVAVGYGLAQIDFIAYVAGL